MTVSLRSMTNRVNKLKKSLNDLINKLEDLDSDGLTLIEMELKDLHEGLNNHLIDCPKPYVKTPLDLINEARGKQVVLNQFKPRPAPISEATFRHSIVASLQNIADIDDGAFEGPASWDKPLNHSDYGVDRSEIEQVFDDIDAQYNIRMDRSVMSASMSISDLVLLAVQAHRNPVEPEFPEEPMPPM